MELVNVRTENVSFITAWWLFKVESFFKVKVYVVANYSCFLLPKATNYTCIESTGEYFVCYLFLHVKVMLLQYIVLKRFEGCVVSCYRLFTERKFLGVYSCFIFAMTSLAYSNLYCRASNNAWASTRTSVTSLFNPSDSYSSFPMRNSDHREMR